MPNYGLARSSFRATVKRYHKMADKRSNYFILFSKGLIYMSKTYEVSESDSECEETSTCSKKSDNDGYEEVKGFDEL